jgi:hypothetical protein
MLIIILVIVPQKFGTGNPIPSLVPLRKNLVLLIQVTWIGTGNLKPNCNGWLIVE